MKNFNIGTLITKEEMLNSLVDVPVVTKTERKNGNNLEVEYINISCAFDIETSSFTTIDGTKLSCMYIWQFGINGDVIIGRTWEEFEEFMSELSIRLNLSYMRRLPIYVHNLSYEFQWIKRRFTWMDIFAREKRSPMKALTSNGFEFRCSYMLSGCSLEQTCENLTKYKVNKKVGDLDYRTIRVPVTPLTNVEIGYCIYDVIGVMCYVQEEIEEYGDVIKVPMTNTGKVRLYCRNHCLTGENEKNYRYLMRSLTLDGADEYNILKEAFQAGYTHANWQNSGEVFTDVYSMDFTSSYPAVMFDKMPMTKGEWVIVDKIGQIENLIKLGYYLIFKIQFGTIVEKEDIPDHYISCHRCHGARNIKVDNGRLISADRIQLTITSDDWEIIKRCYDFDRNDIVIGDCIRYGTGYLPKCLLECVLSFYKDKTTLKDIPEFAGEYQRKKGMLNSVAGMCLTDIVCEEIGYDDEWISSGSDTEKAIKEYNKSATRFLYFPWGIAVCSRARLALWTAILELGQDYIYSDTDSVKFINMEAHKDYFDQYNEHITNKIRKACKINKLNFEDTHPKTVKGVEKPLGVWDFDGYYKRFKTLGAKRYLVETEDGEIKATIAGANKKLVSKYIASKDNPFEFFEDKMSVDKEHSGRLIHAYIDDPYDYEITDYLGNHYTGHELSGIHLAESEYNLKLSPIYAQLLGLRETRFH